MVAAVMKYLSKQDADRKEKGAEIGTKSAILRSKAVEVLLADKEFVALLPRFKDMETVVAWIDRLYKGWKHAVPKKDVIQSIARDLNIDESGARKKLIERIMTTDMYATAI
jgi:hypothetical protein